MVKTIEYLKRTWFKNDDDKGGAMAHAISSKKNDEICIISETQKNGRIWSTIEPNKFIKFLSKNLGLYEIITDYPHKMFFDIDKKGPSTETFISDIKDIILTYFPNAEMAISGSVTDEKTSYHIVLQNYVIHNSNEQSLIKSVIIYINKNICNSFDYVVYSKNRNMKCINQSKQDGRVQEIIENQDYKAHCITCFLPTYSLPFEVSLPIEIKEHIEIEKSKATFDLSTLPVMNLSTDTYKIFNCLTPNEILEMLPINKSFLHNYTHLVARFCYYNNIEFKLFLSWVLKKHIEKKKDLQVESDRWAYHWDRLKNYPPVSSEKIKQVLCVFYPNLKKDPCYREFADTFNFPRENVIKIPTISQNEYKGDEKYAIFNIGMGGGKTYQTVEYLKPECSFCWIAPNRALAHNTFNRLNESNIDVTHYGSVNTDKKKTGFLKEKNNMLIVANSLHYLFEKTYDIIVIDEIETLLDKWFGTFMQKKAENWTVFLNIIRKAKKVILLDAFITTKTLKFITSCDQNNDYKIYERLYEPSTRTINYIADFTEMFDNIISDLNKGLKLFIFYPYKNKSMMNNGAISMQAFYDMIVKKTGQTGIFYNSDIDEKIKIGLKNVNTAWEGSTFIITNSMITCGVNYENEDFDTEYLFISSFSTPRDVIQVSYRPRFLRSGIINVSYIGAMIQQNTWETDTHELTCPIYNKLIYTILVEKKSPIKKTFQLFCVKAKYKQVTDTKKLIKQLQEERANLLQKYEMGYNYIGIEDIDFSYELILQSKLFAGEATMREKFMLQKYHFKNKFLEESHNISFNENGPSCLEEAWNSQYLFFFDQIRKHLSKGKDSIFYKIKNLNNFDKFFNFDVKKAKLNDDIKSQIFREFKFKYITNTSSTTKIICDIYNTFFGVKIISVWYNDNSNAPIYTTSDFFDIWLDFVQKYNREPFLDVDDNDTSYGCDIL